MTILYSFGKSIFLVGILVNGYLIILDTYMNETFDNQMQKMFSTFIKLEHIIPYTNKLRVGIGICQIFSFYLLGYESSALCIFNMITYSIYCIIYNGIGFFSDKEEEKAVAIQRILRYFIVLSGYFLFLAGIKPKRHRTHRRVANIEEKEKNE